MPQSCPPALSLHAGIENNTQSPHSEIEVSHAEDAQAARVFGREAEEFAHKQASCMIGHVMQAALTSLPPQVCAWLGEGQVGIHIFALSASFTAGSQCNYGCDV